MAQEADSVEITKLSEAQPQVSRTIRGDHLTVGISVDHRDAVIEILAFGRGLRIECEPKEARIILDCLKTCIEECEKTRVGDN